MGTYKVFITFRSEEDMVNAINNEGEPLSKMFAQIRQLGKEEVC